MIVPVVLAGGNGVRLWPLSRASHPKPYLPLLPDGVSPFQAAVKAAAAWGDPLVLGRDDHRFLAAEQLASLGLDGRLVLEPEPRGGGAAMALAACMVPPDAELLVLPSESPGGLPEPSQPSVSGWSTGRSGDRVLWDRVSARRVLQVVQELVGEQRLEAVRRAARTTEDLSFERVDPRIWADVPHLDAELLRRAAGASTVPVTADEHAIDWRGVHAARAVDGHGNALVGDAVALGAKGCLVHASSRLVAVLDVEELAIIETADAVLVAPLGAGARVRDLVHRLEAQGRVETRLPTRILRPWGAYEPIGRGPRWLAKRIVVQPGHALSLQRHSHRAEHWVVVSGRARVRRGEERFDLEVDASTYIPRGVLHRLENVGDEPLVLVEVQTGDHLDEADIERLEDRYGRRD